MRRKQTADQPPLGTGVRRLLRHLPGGLHGGTGGFRQQARSTAAHPPGRRALARAGPGPGRALGPTLIRVVDEQARAWTTGAGMAVRSPPGWGRAGSCGS
ncbi:hypothetical protein GXW82_04145 [Streptacidiphilus sp. 4-A2]|nr:hypothetical protein [Streptacidiphilus sp. 4-A2]